MNTRPPALEQPPRSCPACGNVLPPAFLACPVCHQLVYAERLKSIAAEAERAEQANRIPEALGLWREAIELLPRDTQQYSAVRDKITALSNRTGAELGAPFRRGTASGAAPPPARPAGRKWAKGWGWLGLLAALVWKFKVVLVFILTKAKFLLLGLTKGGTLLSMLVSMGFYWSLWGWKFAAGVIVSIYIHEMGHVFWLQRYGIKATAPMFIPGFGAMIRLKQYPSTPAEEARVGLAGPLWGLGAALLAGALYLGTQAPYWGALARFGGWINLFNLLPVWQLDGAHAFKALTRGQRALVTAAFGGLFFFTGEGLLVILGLVSLFRLFGKDAPSTPDHWVLGLFLVLAVILSLLVALPVMVHP